MTHIAVRRWALGVASVSFSLLTALVLVVSAAYSDGLMAEKQTAGTEVYLEQSGVSFPYAISCTALVVEHVSSYDGPFYEDGSGREVFNTAAILVRNTGSSMIPYAHIILRTQNTSYIFDGYLLAPGASVLIPEKYALPYIPPKEVISCFGWATVMQQAQTYSITIEEIGMGELCVTNLSGSQLTNLTLYHKTYLPKEDLYIGGAAFVSRIDRIDAGESIVLSPNHYAAGYSKIIYYE